MDKPKTGFVIKLSNETVQKLSDDNISSTTPKQTESSKETKDAEVTKSYVNCSTTALDTKDDIKANVNENNQDQSNPPADASKSEIKPSEEKAVDWGEYSPYITYEGEVAIYTDPTTQQKYTWDKESTSWKPISGETEATGRVYSYENDQHVYTESDGSKYFYDVDKKAWIPKVDDDFLAFYQMSYGFVDNAPKEKETCDEDVDKKKKAEPAGVKRKSEPQWFQASEQSNTKVYVSNLPLDLTEEEFVDFMQKCGLVMRDPSTQKMKIKLYMDKEQNCFKGDALCTYIKRESVDLALKLLDGSDFKGNKIKVELAHFQLKGEYNPALKPKKKKKKELEKIKRMQEKLFDWRPEKFIGERSKHERVVIVKNLFHPSDFDKEVQLILDYQQDLREECGKCGEVRKVVIYDRHPEGVAQITMKEPEMADAVIALINGRWFGKRQISAEIWDGRTKYRIAETDADINKRIDKWGRFLEEGEESENKETAENKTDTGQTEGPVVTIEKDKKEAVSETITTEETLL